MLWVLRIVGRLCQSPSPSLVLSRAYILKVLVDSPGNKPVLHYSSFLSCFFEIRANGKIRRRLIATYYHVACHVKCFGFFDHPFNF